MAWYGPPRERLGFQIPLGSNSQSIVLTSYFFEWCEYHCCFFYHVMRCTNMTSEDLSICVLIIKTIGPWMQIFHCILPDIVFVSCRWPQEADRATACLVEHGNVVPKFFCHPFISSSSSLFFLLSGGPCIFCMGSTPLWGGALSSLSMQRIFLLVFYVLFW